jgi:predicted nucleic acid-binding Zn ribbon protein
MKGEKAICAVCKKEFIKKTRKGRTCSEECRIKLWRAEHRETLKKVCPICGAAFETTDSKTKYCSDSCKERARLEKRLASYAAKTLPPKNCAECGKEFVPTSEGKIYCSPECKKARRRREGNGTYAPKNCAVCGKEFTPRASQAKYCSEECYKKHLSMQNQKRIIETPVVEEPTQQTTPVKKTMVKLNAAARRWATMSWDEVVRENMYYGLRYPDSQTMAYAGTLPRNYGKEHKQ